MKMINGTAIQKIFTTSLKLGPISICLFLLLLNEDAYINLESVMLLLIFGSVGGIIIAFGASIFLFLPLTYYAEKTGFAHSASDMFRRLLPALILLFGPLTVVPFLFDGIAMGTIPFSFCYTTFFSSVIGWMIYTNDYCTIKFQ